MNRIDSLDGLRGVAILLVIFYHAYARWSPLVPYGDSLADIAVIKYGYLGVELFFLVSGYVILMTLERCPAMPEFLYRRWLRLFPGMLICSVLLYALSFVFPDRPLGAPTVTSLLPGLTFIEPAWWAKLLGQPIRPLEGAFWSLYVEVKFYVIAAALYYWRGRHVMLAGLLAAFALACASRALGSAGVEGPARLLVIVVAQGSFDQFGWFASGAAFYLHSRAAGDRRWLVFAVAVALASAVAAHGVAGQPLLAAVLMAALFTLSFVSRAVRQLLASRLLRFFGFISYPLYLLHQNLLISVVVALGHTTAGFLRSAWSPLLPMLLLSGAAYVIASALEPGLKHAIAARLPRPRERPAR